MYKKHMNVIYEDNHIIIVNKDAGEIVQGDKTGDRTLADDVKQYIKEKYAKPGAVFLGTVHRLDRPVSGIVIFARTSKALSRMNEMFKKGEVHKTYHAIVPREPENPAKGMAERQRLDEGITLKHYLTRNERQNRAYAFSRETPGAKTAILDVRRIAMAERLQMLEINLHTGRHHQIRCQLSAIGLPIRGDLKYGAPRSNPDGSICLHARHVEFVHPVSKQHISVTASYPPLNIWDIFRSEA